MNSNSENREQRTVNRFFVRKICVICVICGSFLFSCTTNNSDLQKLVIERDGQEIAVVRIELAVTQEERMQGLMYRETLADGEGMLFIFEYDQILSFWMKNTVIPLSIAYITSDGRIVDILDMYPNDLNSVYSSRSVRYALEVPQGWFNRAGVRIGDRIKIEDLEIE